MVEKRQSQQTTGLLSSHSPYVPYFLMIVLEARFSIYKIVADDDDMFPAPAPVTQCDISCVSSVCVSLSHVSLLNEGVLFYFSDCQNMFIFNLAVTENK